MLGYRHLQSLGDNLSIDNVIYLTLSAMYRQVSFLVVTQAFQMPVVRPAQSKESLLAAIRNMKPGQ